jgi:hypothetical protein
MEAAEKFFVPFKKFLQRIEKEAFAKPARAGEKVAASVVDELQSKLCLVDIVAILLAKNRKGLNPDREFPAAHALKFRQDL